MDDTFSTLFIIFVICCLPPLAIGGPLTFVWYRRKQRIEGSAAIGAALNLQPTVKAKQMQWYEGRLATGHLFAYVPIIFQRDYYNHDAQRRRTHDSAARLVLQVRRKEPLGVDAFRHEKWTEKKNPLHTFETGFRTKNGARLTAMQQDALLAFAQQHPGTLWLRDRQGASEQVFNSPEILAGATTFLLHEYKVVNPDPEAIKDKVRAMVQLARLFEE